MTNDSPIRWRDIARWVFAGVVGWLLGVLFFIHMPEFIPDIGGLGVGLLVNAFLSGIVIGAIQWISLKRTLPRPASWIFATGLGFLIAIVLFFKLTSLDIESTLLTSIILGLILGLSIGLLQTVSWHRHRGRVRWWTTSTVLGTIAGFLVVLLIESWPLLSQLVPSDGLIFLIVPALMNSLTGLALRYHMQLRPSVPY